jgi:hypothetical protein
LRAILALVATAALLLPPTASADFQDLRAPSVVTAYRTATGPVLLAWSPGFAAVDYVVYRGTEAGHLREIHEGPVPEFYDASAPEAGLLIYVISAIDPQGQASSTEVTSSSGGDCVAMSETLSFQVSLGNCMTIIPEL